MADYTSIVRTACGWDLPIHGAAVCVLLARASDARTVAEASECLLRARDLLDGMHTAVRQGRAHVLAPMTADQDSIAEALMEGDHGSGTGDLGRGTGDRGPGTRPAVELLDDKMWCAGCDTWKGHTAFRGRSNRCGACQARDRARLARAESLAEAERGKG